jgi:hypothetical protein
MTDDRSDADRRQGDRLHVYSPADVRGAGTGPGLSLVHDLSVTGALLLSATAYEPGKMLDLSLRVGEGLNQTVPAAGEVVRCAERNRASLWRYEVAIRFKEPLEQHKAEIEAASRDLPRLGTGS